MNREIALLSCPFCGSPARIFEPRHGGSAVTCTNHEEEFTEKWDRAKLYCRAAMGDRGMPYGTDKEAADAWNRRA